MMRFFYRLLSSWWRLFLSMMLGLFLYGYTFLNHPEEFNDIDDSISGFVQNIEYKSGMAQETRRWFKLMSIDDKFVFMAYIFIARIVVALIGLLIVSFPAYLWRKARPAPVEAAQVSS